MRLCNVADRPASVASVWVKLLNCVALDGMAFEKSVSNAKRAARTIDCVGVYDKMH